MRLSPVYSGFSDNQRNPITFTLKWHIRYIFWYKSKIHWHFASRNSHHDIPAVGTGTTRKCPSREYARYFIESATVKLWFVMLWLYNQIIFPKVMQLMYPYFITMTSCWARWRLKLPASRLSTQPFIQGADQRKFQSSAPLAFVRGIHRWPLNSPHKGSVTRRMFPFDDVIVCRSWFTTLRQSYDDCLITCDSIY